MIWLKELHNSKIIEQSYLKPMHQTLAEASLAPDPSVW